MWSSSQVYSIGPFWLTFWWHFVYISLTLIKKFRTKLRDKYGGYLWQVPASADVLPRSVKTCAIQKLRSVGHLTCEFPTDKPAGTCGWPRLMLTLIPHWNCLFGQITYLPIWIIPLHVFNIGCVIHDQDPFFNVNSTVMSIWWSD